MNKEGWRPATHAEIVRYLGIIDHQSIEAAIKSGICFMSEDGEKFCLDNTSRFHEILTERYLRSYDL